MRTDFAFDGDVPVDPVSWVPLTHGEIELRVEALREDLRGVYERLRREGLTDGLARQELEPLLALVTKIDRLCGSVGDPLASTSENDWT